MRATRTTTISNPLLRLHATYRDANPLICIPGAGASITTFVDLVGSLGDQWPIYGLQPRGIDPSEPPHDTIEDAASHNLHAISALLATGPIHLLGHSHGGLVAFEMAIRLSKQGKPPASLTLIDTEPPASHKPKRDGELIEIFREYVSALEGNYAKRLAIDESVIKIGLVDLFLGRIHSALVREGCLSSQTKPEMLHGSFVTYAAAVRCPYKPAIHYVGELDLVLASVESISSKGTPMSPKSWSEEWRSFATTIDVLVAPGDHFSMLRAPQVDAIANWWRKKQALRVMT
jgi:thioesterase domain-containing protein